MGFNHIHIAENDGVGTAQFLTDVRRQDDHDGSSTEVEESLMGDEKSHWNDSIFQRKKPISLREKLLAPFGSGGWLYRERRITRGRSLAT